RRVGCRRIGGGGESRRHATAVQQVGKLGGGIAGFHQEGNGRHGRPPEPGGVFLEPSRRAAQFAPGRHRLRVAAQERVPEARFRGQQVIASRGPRLGQRQFQGVERNQ